MTTLPEPTRRSYLSMHPSSLTVVGVDTTDGPEHPLWDERIHLPVNESLVASIIADGIIEPVIGETDGDRTLVVAGRQRVLHARLAQARGHDVRVPVILRRGDAKAMMGVAITENEIRTGDTPITRAKKALRMVNLGASEAEVAQKFGVKPETISEWLKLTELDPKVQAQVHSGEIGVNAGLAIAELPRSAQASIVDTLKAEGVTPSAANVLGRVRAARGKAQAQTPKVRVDKASDLLLDLAKLGMVPPADALQEFLKRMALALLGKNWERTVVAVSKAQSEEE